MIQQQNIHTIHTPHPFPLSLIILLRSECTAARAAVAPIVGNVDTRLCEAGIGGRLSEASIRIRSRLCGAGTHVRCVVDRVSNRSFSVCLQGVIAGLEIDCEGLARVILALDLRSPVQLRCPHVFRTPLAPLRCLLLLHVGGLRVSSRAPWLLV